MNKDQIYQEVKQEVIDEIKKVEGTAAEFHLSGSCLYFASYTVRRLRKEGIDAIIQAGTACWPRIYPHQDDGVTPTHFSYVWELNHLTKSRLMMGYLPEMHVWVGIPSTQEIVDLTVGFQREQCQRLMKHDWPGPALPDYIWDHKLPNGVIYTPDRFASKWAYVFADKLCGLK